MRSKTLLISLLFFALQFVFADDPTSMIRINQVGYEINGPKAAVFQSEDSEMKLTDFEVIEAKTGRVVYRGSRGDIEGPDSIMSWGYFEWDEFFPYYFWTMDFSEFKDEGTFKLEVDVDGDKEESFEFDVRENVLFTATVEGLLSCFKEMRYTGNDDKTARLVNSNETVDLYGGYKEASGDDSKHITHLQYANYMNTQEIPCLPWTLLRGYELNDDVFDSLGLKEDLFKEAAWGADYLMRCQHEEGWFYSTIFNGWEHPDWPGRVVCAYIAYNFDDEENSYIDTVTSTYKTAMREAGGMCIAALAAAARHEVEEGDYSPEDYLEAAIKGYDHIKKNNTKYCDDGKENFIDFYCGLLACIELYRATEEKKYKDNAEDWADKLMGRMTDDGWFSCDADEERPYFHAGEEGLPIVTLLYYKDIFNNKKDDILDVVQKNMDYYKEISNKGSNPFNYAHQYNREYFFDDKEYGDFGISYFIPKKNETGYWWQGENARLSSLASAMLWSAKALDPDYKFGNDEITAFALSQLNWILGINPYETCMLYSYGTVNHPDYIGEKGTRGSIDGGICNGIVGEGNTLGEGIEFGPNGDWHDWRWYEQWLPHETWYFNAISTLSYIVRNEGTPINHNSKNVFENSSPVLINTRVANGKIIVNIMSGKYRDVSIKLFNSRGRLLKSIPGLTKRVASINLNDIAEGIYFLRAESGEKMIMKKKITYLR